MQSAQFTPQAACPQPGLRDGPDEGHAAAYDDPQDWAGFSRRCAGKPDADGQADPASGLWESHVLVRGMHCAACAFTLEQALLGVKGVVSARVGAASGRASITWSQAQTRPSAWLAAPRGLGYQLLPASDAFVRSDGRQEARLALWRWLVAGFCMMQVMMYAVPGYFAQPGDITPDIEKLLRWASWVLSLPVCCFHAARFLTTRCVTSGSAESAWTCLWLWASS